jgi:hypothetical protein
MLAPPLASPALTDKQAKASGTTHKLLSLSLSLSLSLVSFTSASLEGYTKIEINA